MSTSGETKVRQYNTLQPNQMGVLDYIQGQIGQPIEAYGGKLTADPSNIQQDVFSNYWNLNKGPAAGLRAAAITDQVAGKPAFDVSAQAYENYFTQSIENPARRDFYGPGGAQEQVLHRYGSGGPSGVARSELANATTDFNLGMAGLKADIGLRGEEARQGSLEAAAGRQLGGIQASAEEETRPLRYGLEIGGEQRAIEQQRLQGDYLNWQQSQPWASPWLQFLPQALGQYNQIGSETSSGGGLWSWLGS
jgi:hypothetical protein